MIHFFNIIPQKKELNIYVLAQHMLKTLGKSKTLHMIANIIKLYQELDKNSCCPYYKIHSKKRKTFNINRKYLIYQAILSYCKAFYFSLIGHCMQILDEILVL